jgi:hypothetical protein
MFSTKLTAALAAAAMAAGAAGLAATAHASVVVTQATTVVDNDALTAVGNSEASLTGANAAFQYSGGSVDVHVTGTLHVVNGTSARYRVRVDSYDRAGNRLSTDYDDPKGTPIHISPKDVTLDMTTTSAPYVDKIEVSIEKQGTSVNWIPRGAMQTTHLSLHDDEVGISGVGIDFGAGPYSSTGTPGYGGPLMFAPFTWTLGDDGKMTGSVDGSIYWDDFSRCGRVVLRYLAPAGYDVHDVTGPQVCPKDDSIYHDPYKLAGDAVAGANAVEVALQSKTGGIWQDVDTQRVSIAE